MGSWSSPWDFKYQPSLVDTLGQIEKAGEWIKGGGHFTNGLNTSLSSTTIISSQQPFYLSAMSHISFAAGWTPSLRGNALWACSLILDLERLDICLDACKDLEKAWMLVELSEVMDKAPLVVELEQCPTD